MGPPSQIDLGSPVPMILPGKDALIRSMVIVESLRDKNRRGRPESARCGDYEGGSAPSSTPLLLPSLTGADPAPARLTPPGSALDPLHHTSALTPPAALPPGDLVTPDAERLFYPWVTLIITTLFKLDVVAGFVLLNACAMIRCKKIWLQQWVGEKGGLGYW
jgi:hypothetical protein